MTARKIKEGYPYTKNAIARLVESFPPPAKLLDVVTRDGYAIHLLKKHGYELFGTDIDDEYVNFCKNRGYNVLLDDFSDTQIEEKFDIVYSSHVIEHCLYPLDFLKSCEKVLKKDGVAFLYFPIERKRGDKKHDGYMKHRAFFWDLDDFRKIVEMSNLKEEQLFVTRTWRSHTEALFVGRKV